VYSFVKQYAMPSSDKKKSLGDSKNKSSSEERTLQKKKLESYNALGQPSASTEEAIRFHAKNDTDLQF